MPTYSTHLSFDARSLPDTGYTTGGDSTTIPGFTSNTGGERIHSGRLEVTGSQFFVTFAAAHKTINEEVEATFGPGFSTQRASIDFRFGQDSGFYHYTRVYLNLGGLNSVQETDAGGGLGGIPGGGSDSPSMGLDASHWYKFRVRCERASGAGVSTTVTIQITDLGTTGVTSTALLWNSGSDTWTKTWNSASQSGVGGALLFGDSAQYARITYRSDAVSEELIPGGGACTAITDTTATFTFDAPTGGSGSYAITYSIADNINGLNLRAAPGGTDGQTTFTLTGLTPDTIYDVGQNVDDGFTTATAFDSASGSNYLTLVTGARTLATARIPVAIAQVGDSITQETSTSTAYSGLQSAGIWARKVDDFYGLPPGTTEYVTIATVGAGAGGYATEPDLTTQADAANSINCTDYAIRFGMNDTESATDFGTYLETMIANVRARVPTLERIWLLYTTYPDGLPPGNPQDPGRHPRLRAYQAKIQEIVAADDGADGVEVLAGNPWVYEYLNLHPSLVQDGIHPTQAAGIDAVGRLDAEWWFYETVMELGASSSTTGGGGTPQPINVFGSAVISVFPN